MQHSLVKRVNWYAWTTAFHPFYVQESAHPIPVADISLSEVAGTQDYIRGQDNLRCYANTGWAFAADLRPGAVLSGGTVVLHVQNSTQTHPCTVYNLRVRDTHTYFAGSSAVLTHNSNYDIIANRDAVAKQMLASKPLPAKITSANFVHDKLQDLPNAAKSPIQLRSKGMRDLEPTGLNKFQAKQARSLSNTTEVAARHTEWQGTLLMREAEATKGVMVINNPKGVCDEFCKHVDGVMRLLPDNSGLHVLDPNGVWTVFKKP